MSNSVYFRHKTENGWRYQSVGVGAPSAAQRAATQFFIRTRSANGRGYTWKSFNTIEHAKTAAETQPEIQKALKSGLTVLESGEVTNRKPVANAVEAFLTETEKSKGRATLQVYTNTLNQFAEFLKNRKIVFLDQIDRETVRAYRDFLRDGGVRGKKYEPHTITNRTVTVISFLKANDIKTGFSLSKDLPKIDEQPAIPYSEDELKKLFAVMTPDELIRYKFFLGTAAREREVMFASWADIDFAKGLFHVRPKPDAGFTIKNDQVRVVRMPKELIALLLEYKKRAPHSRWLFVNRDEKPDGKMLQKLKFIAKRAGLNCGECVTTLRLGRYNRQPREVCCDDAPVCTKFYLHRFRKTCATRWSNEFKVPVRTIQHMLGHKSLEVTQRYLGVSDLETVNVG